MNTVIGRASNVLGDFKNFILFLFNIDNPLFLCNVLNVTSFEEQFYQELKPEVVKKVLPAVLKSLILQAIEMKDTKEKQQAWLREEQPDKTLFGVASGISLYDCVRDEA